MKLLKFWMISYHQIRYHGKTLKIYARMIAKAMIATAITKIKDKTKTVAEAIEFLRDPCIPLEKCLLNLS